MNRREFLTRSSLLGSASAMPGMLSAADGPVAETVVKTLFDSLSKAQLEKLHFAFDDPLRTKISNNWHITKPRVGSFLSDDQNAMVREIFRKAHSDEYAETVLEQVIHDSGTKGFEDSSIAIFGEPGTGRFQFVLTGRHCTRRVDGDSVKGKAFGGPIFYGHAADGFYEGPTHPGNAYWFQAERANGVFDMLDGKQRESALLSYEPADEASTVKLRRSTGDLPGIAYSELSDDQQREVIAVLDDLLLPFREEDRKESMALIRKAGMDNVHLSFYSENDIGNDGVWDTWRLEGPHMVWYFRGAPHVHTWVHISDPDLPRPPRA